MLRTRLQKYTPYLIAGILLSASCAQAGYLKSTASDGATANGYQATAYNAGALGDFDIQGHFMLKGGLGVFGGVNAIVDVDGISNGPLSLLATNAVIKLSGDLRLGSTASFSLPNGTSLSTNEGFATPNGNRRIVMSNNITIGTSSLQKNLNLTTGGTDLTIDGQGNKLTLLHDSTINLRTGASLTLKNMILELESTITTTGHFNTAASGNTITLENVTVRGKNNGTAVTGITGACALIIRGRVRYESPGTTITLKSSAGPQTITIDKNSTLYVGPNTKFRMQELADRVTGITMTDQTSTLHLNGCDFYLGPTNASGFNITKGTVILENQVRIFDCDIGSETTPNSDMTRGLILGDGTATNDVNVRLLSDAYVTVDGCLQYKHS